MEMRREQSTTNGDRQPTTNEQRTSSSTNITCNGGHSISPHEQSSKRFDPINDINPIWPGYLIHYK
jgi:hypothetical protein